MNEIFGVSMTSIMIVLLIMLAICLLTVAWVAIRRTVVFKLGVRNIPRRKAQTILIVVGLMLSTLIIAAALGTGDTIDHSATAATYDSLGAADELVVASKDDEGEGNFVNAVDQLLPQNVTEQIEAEFAGTDLVDGVLPVLIQQVPAIKLVDGQPSLSEPSIYLVGIDPVRAEQFGGLQTTGGDRIDLGAIALNEVVISEDLADELDAGAGDTIAVYYNNTPIPLTVAAVAEDSPLSGKFDQATPGMVVPLERLQAATNLEGQVTTIAVSNRGGIESGIKQTDEVSDRLIALFANEPYGVDKIKQNNIEFAETFANIFTSFFLVFGLFSIAVGILLIVLIFTMLAAERRSEMGMTRAVGAQRRQLMQQFVSEGTVYALAAGLVGAALGVGAAYVIGYAVRPILGEFLTIEPNVTWRSMVVAYSLGVVITFVAVVASSWKISYLNIVAAIRDIAEVSNAGADRRVLRHGKVKSALVILGIGLVGLVVGGALSSAGSTADGATSGEQAMAGFGPVLIGLAGVLLNWGLHRLLRPFWGIVFVLGGIAGTIGGLSADSAFLFYGGMSLLPFGLAILLRYFGVSSRLVFSIAGLYIVVLWLLPPGVSESLFGDIGTSGGIEMFFLSGIFMVAGATIVIVQNLDVLLAAVSRAGGLFRSKLPAVRTAVAFPGAAKGRTGMTIAMFSLIVFSLVVFATINQNFTDIFLSDDANAGWDVRADTSGSNPIGDTDMFLQLVASKGVDTSDVTGAGQITATFQNNMRRPGMEDWKFFPVVGMDDDFLDESDVFFQQRATGLADDAAVIEALRTQPDAVVVSSSALEVSGDFGADPTMFTLADPDGDGPQQALTSDDKVFDPIPVEIEGVDGAVHTVRVIGVIDTKISTLFGMYGSQRLTSQIKPDPSVISYFLRLSDPEQAEDKAKQIETALVTNGVQGTSIQDELEESQQQSTGFLYIFQGFMGLGLVVGIAAVGVIAFRSVVERRQQIGVLRAIGYQQSLVAESFLIETLFVVGMGVISGTVLGLILARNLFSSEDFTGVEDATFTVPWLVISVILVITIIAALLMTLVPARQASRLAPAEALRYE